MASGGLILSLWNTVAQHFLAWSSDLENRLCVPAVTVCVGGCFFEADGEERERAEVDKGEGSGR